MSNIIPPLLSDSPPPMVAALDDEDDDFGDFTSAGGASYNYDNYSLPSTPHHVAATDINSNTNKLEVLTDSPSIPELFIIPTHKDFQDKRKNCDLESISATEVNSIKHQPSVNSVHIDKDIYYCNQTVTTDQQLPTESVPIRERLLENCLTHLEAAKTKKEGDTVVMNDDHFMCSNKEEIVENIPANDVNVPSSTDKIGAIDTTCSRHISSDNESYNEALEVPFKASKGTNDSREGYQTVTVDTNEIFVKPDKIDNTTNIDIDNFFYDEEPPDLDIIDDPTIETDDFAYNNYKNDFGNEYIYNKSEKERDVNKNTVSCKKDDTSVNESPECVDHEDKIENILLSECNDCCNDKIENDFVEGDRLNIHLVENVKHNKFNFDNTNNYDNSHVNYGDAKTVNAYETLPQSMESDITHEDAEKPEECFSCPHVSEWKTVDDESIYRICDMNDEDKSTYLVSNEKTADAVKNCGDFAKPIINSNISIIEEEANEVKNSTTSAHNVNDGNGSKTNDFCNMNDTSLAYNREEMNLGDFADFSHSFPETVSDVPKVQVITSDKISSLSEQLKETELGDFEDEDLQNFGDFTQSTVSACLPSSISTNTQVIDAVNITKKDILEYAEKILLEVFPLCINDCENYVGVEYLDNNQLFNQMKDITETNALSYQWAKSTSQEKLLNALNVDTRNILYGPGWNALLPKFAANLKTTPLEPVKSEMLTPTTSYIPNPNPSFMQSRSISTEVPSAQFDWKSAGLVNPLDSLPPDPKGKTYNLDMKTEQNEQSLDFLSHCQSHSDSESVKSLQLTTDIDKSDANSNPVEDFDDFTGHQPSPTLWHKNVPLKETYISSELFVNKQSDQFSLLTSSVLAPEATKKSTESTEEDDEFTDFQMSLPLQAANELNSSIQKADIETKTLVSDVLQPIPALKSLKSCSISKMVSTQPEILWPDPGITSDELLRIELNYCRKTSCNNLEDTNVDRTQTENKKHNLQIISNQNKIASLPRLENITDDKVINGNLEFKDVRADIQYEFNTYEDTTKEDTLLSTKSQQSNISLCPSSIHIANEDKVKVTKGNINCQVSKTFANISQHGCVGKENMVTNYKSRTEKASSIDIDDEWSDFVCNPEPLKYPSKPISTLNLLERTNTPELQLSIPHLSQLQPPKQPIPVITPHGLIQTKIPSNTSNLSLYQPTSHNSVSKNVSQPSIISQQYQNHFNGPVFPKLPHNGIKIQENFQQLNLQPYESIEKHNSNDDDWTEFVSSAPVQQTKIQQQRNQKQNCNGWSGLIPNIITNPAHFDLCNYMSQKPQNNNTVLNFAKGMVPSISALPELDFATPKSKVFKKK